MYGLPWEVSGAVPMESGLSHRRRWGKAQEKSAEAIVVPESGDEGPNPLLQGASREDSMGVKRQQGTAYQLSLFEGEKGAVRPGAGGEGGTGTAAYEEQQRPTASERKRALPEALMEEVVEPVNLNRSYQRVKANKGAPGVDGMTVDDLSGWLAEHREELKASLLAGSYRPQPVRGVEIPKPGGGVRQLGIPTVVDRLVQQAILQVLEPLLDPTFSEWSYGFRPGRNAHQALRQAQEYVADGREIVVDLDWKNSLTG